MGTWSVGIWADDVAQDLIALMEMRIIGLNMIK